MSLDALLLNHNGRHLNASLLGPLDVSDFSFVDNLLGGAGAGNFTVKAAWESTEVANLNAGNMVKFYLRSDHNTATVASGATTITVANGSRFLVGKEIALYDGVNHDIAAVTAVSGNTVTIGTATTHTYGIGTNVMQLRYRGMISCVTQDINLDPTIKVETVSYFSQLLHFVEDTFTGGGKECGWVLYQLLNKHASEIDVVVNTANFVMSATGTTGTGTTVGYSATGTNQTTGSLIQDLCKVASQNAAGTAYTLWVDEFATVYFAPIATPPLGTDGKPAANPTLTALGTAITSMIGSLASWKYTPAKVTTIDLVNYQNNTGAGNADGLYDSIGALTRRYQDITNLQNVVKVMGGTDKSTNSSLSIVVENSNSISTYGQSEGTLSNPYIDNAQDLANWAKWQVENSAYPTETYQMSLLCSGSFITSRDIVNITGFTDASNLAFNAFAVTTKWDAKYFGQFQQDVQGGDIHPDVTRIMKQIAGQHYVETKNAIDATSNLKDRFVQWGLNLTNSGTTATLSQGALGANILVSGTTQLQEFDITSGSFTTSGDNTYTIAYVYRNLDGTQYASPQGIMYTGTTAANYSGALGTLTDYQVVPLWSFTQLGGQILTPFTDRRNLGGVTGLHLVPNPTPATAPQLTASATLSYLNVGQSAYDVQFPFQLSVGSPDWLRYIIFYVVTHGTTPNGSTHVWTKIPCVSSGNYNTVTLLGLTAGVQWDIYCAFQDEQGNIDAATLVGSTTSNPQAIQPANLPSVPSGFAFTAASASITYGAVNAGGYTANFTASINITNLGTGSPTLASWLDHVELLIAPAGSGNFSVNTTIPAGGFVAAGTAVSLNGLGAGQAYDVAYRLVALNKQSFTSTGTVFTTTAQFIGTSSQQTMPAALKTSGPTVSATVKNSRLRAIGSTQNITGTVTVSDYGTTAGKPQWLQAIMAYARVNGTTVVVDQVQIDPNAAASTTTTTETYNWTLPGGTGDSVDIGFAYEDASGQLSTIVWPATLQNIADPDGAVWDGTGKGLHTRQSVGVQAALDSLGNQLNLEFVGGKEQADGSWTNIDGKTGATAYALISGQPFTASGDIAKGVAAGHAAIILGTTTNGYSIRSDAAGNQFLSKYVAGVLSNISAGVSPPSDTNYHTYRLTVIPGATNTLEGSIDGNYFSVPDASLSLTSGTWAITLLTGGSTGKVQHFTGANTLYHHGNMSQPVTNAINLDASVNHAVPNLFPNADLAGGTGTTGIDGTYNTGSVPKFFEAYNPTSYGEACVYAIDTGAGAPFGSALKLTYSKNTGYKGFGTGDATNKPDGFGPLTLKANGKYVVSFYAKSSVSNTSFSVFTTAGAATISQLLNYPTLYNDTNWHRYAFLVTVGSSDYTGGLFPYTSTPGPRLSAPAAPTLTPSGSGGSIANGTYGYRVSAVNSVGETLAGTEATTTVSGATTTVSTPASPTLTGSNTGGTLGNGTYAYRLSATNSAGETLASTEVSTTLSGATSTIAAPVAPTLSTVSGTNSTSQTLWFEQSVVNASGETTAGASSSVAVTASSTTTTTVNITSGTTYTIPADYSSLVSIECYGGGGHGSDGLAGSSGGNGGGGGGAYAKITSLALSANQVVNIQLGAATDTWFGAATTVKAAKGATSTGTGAAGGTTANSVGTTLFAGGNGANGAGSGGAGGGCGGSTGAGSGSTGGGGDAGNGGAGGTGSSVITVGGNGTVGANYGGGGGGGGESKSTGTPGLGAAGASGIIVFTYNAGTSGTLAQVATPATPGSGSPTGWNLYAATASGGPFYKQNASPIAFGTGWTQASGGGITTGTANPPGSNTATYTTGSVALAWTSVSGATGYNVYGRTSGAELRMATLGNVTSWTDNGSVAPSGALPGSNTTTINSGSVALSWGAVSGASSYNVYGRTAGSELKIANTASTSYTDTGSITPTGALPGSNTAYTSMNVWFAAPKTGEGSILGPWVGSFHAMLPGLSNVLDFAGQASKSTFLNAQGSMGIVKGAPTLSYTATSGTTSADLSITMPVFTLTLADGSTLSGGGTTYNYPSVGLSTTYTFDWGCSIYGNAVHSSNIIGDFFNVPTTVYSDGYIPFVINWQITTPAASTNSSGSQTTAIGTNKTTSCPADYQLVLTQEHGYIRADELDIGMHLPAFGGGWNEVHDVQKLPASLWQFTVARDGVAESFAVNDTHAVKDADGTWLRICDMTPGDKVLGKNGTLTVTDAHYLCEGHYIAIDVETHEFAMGDTLAHNAITL